MKELIKQLTTVQMVNTYNSSISKIEKAVFLLAERSPLFIRTESQL